MLKQLLAGRRKFKNSKYHDYFVIVLAAGLSLSAFDNAKHNVGSAKNAHYIIAGIFGFCAVFFIVDTILYFTIGDGKSNAS